MLFTNIIHDLQEKVNICDKICENISQKDGLPKQAVLGKQIIHPSF